jgi:Fur family ferric uptake transcriptional regulator
MKEDLSNILKKSGFKITPIRLAILEVFSHDCEPINAEFIFKKLKKEKVNIVTIYRTLTSFENTGILKRVDLQKDSVYYELAGHHHHHHIICTDCGLVEGFEVCDLDNLTDKVLKTSNKFNIITKHSLELFGVCKKCQNK